MAYLGIGIAVAVAAVLVVFFVASPLTTSTSGTGTTSPLTYDAARPIADHTVGGFQGGGWNLLFAVGLVSPTNESFPTNTSVFNSSLECTFTPAGNLAGITLPSFSGNRSSGEAPAWEFGYSNGSGAIAVVSVVHGQGTILGTVTGFECAIFAELIKAVPSNAIDSSQAALAVRPLAASFLTAHPNATAEFAIDGGYDFSGHSAGPQWSIVYTSCPLSSSASGTGAEFSANVSAVSGTVLANHTGAVSCGSSSSTLAVPASGTPVGATAVFVARAN